jgi:hypothetical protein
MVLHLFHALLLRFVSCEVGFVELAAPFWAAGEANACLFALCSILPMHRRAAAQSGV